MSKKKCCSTSNTGDCCSFTHVSRCALASRMWKNVVWVKIHSPSMQRTNWEKKKKKGGEVSACFTLSLSGSFFRSNWALSHRWCYRLSHRIDNTRSSDPWRKMRKEHLTHGCLVRAYKTYGQQIIGCQFDTRRRSNHLMSDRAFPMASNRSEAGVRRTLISIFCWFCTQIHDDEDD